MKAMMQGIEGLNFAIPVDGLRYFLHNRDAFAFDSRNPNAGYRYLSPTSLLGKKLTAPATASAPPPSLSP
jgi:serine protease Do